MRPVKKSGKPGGKATQSNAVAPANDMEATPTWRKPAGKEYNAFRQSELFNRFRCMCLDMHGHPMARDPAPELEQRIARKFVEVQKEFLRK